MDGMCMKNDTVLQDMQLDTREKKEKEGPV